MYFSIYARIFPLYIEESMDEPEGPPRPLEDFFPELSIALKQPRILLSFFMYILSHGDVCKLTAHEASLQAVPLYANR